jgi:hypothetical protein
VSFTELKFFIVVKGFAQGKWLYRDIWELCEPISALLYYLLPSSFSFFSVTSFWLNSFLIVFNAFYANYLLQKYDVMSEKTFLPAFFYVALSFSSSQLNTLSPPLIASFFLLFVIQKTLSYLKKEDINEMYDAGFFLGIASFCYMPTLAMTIALFLSLLFFTRSHGKAYLLLLLGVLFPWLFISVIYLWNGGLQEVFSVFLHHYFTLRYDYLSWSELVYSSLIPGSLFLTGLFYSLSGRAREINYQSICRRFFLVWLLGNVLVFVVSPIHTLADFHIFLPSLIFFLSYYYLQIKKTAIPNLLITTSLIGMVTIQYFYLGGSIWAKEHEKSFVSIPAKDPLLSGKRIWVVGNNYLPYLQGTISAKYVNWRVSQDDFGKLNSFTTLEHIRKNVLFSNPEIIVDQEQKMKDLFDRIPPLSEHYTLVAPNVYAHR